MAHNTGETMTILLVILLGMLLGLYLSWTRQSRRVIFHGVLLGLGLVFGMFLEGALVVSMLSQTLPSTMQGVDVTQEAASAMIYRPTPELTQLVTYPIAGMAVLLALFLVGASLGVAIVQTYRFIQVKRARSKSQNIPF